MVFKAVFSTLKQLRNLAKVTPVSTNIRQGSIGFQIPSAMDPSATYKNGSTAYMPYTHCKTRTVDLVSLEIPETATETEYKQLYKQLSISGTLAARALTDAVSSISLGIAPPVAFPTETVYGLGADATNRASIAGIFAAKGRPSDNPLIVHVASKEHLERLTGEAIPAVYADLVQEHWPGPLTVLIPVPKEDSVFAENVHPGQRTIGFRVPESKYARFFIAATGKPIAGPSANSSGKPSPTTAQHVMDDLKGKINFILDGGTCNVGVESTVVDGLHDPPLILRPGGLSQDDLIAHGKKFGNAWANVGIGYKQSHAVDINGTHPEEAPRAPGMKYKHYAPQGQMILFEGNNSARNVQAEVDSLLDATRPVMNGSVDHSPSHPNHAQTAESFSVAILTSTSWSSSAYLPVTATTTTPATTTTTLENATAPTDPVDQFLPTSYRNNYKVHILHLGTTPKQIAQNLFAALRTCDDLGCRFILAEAPSEDAIPSVNGDVHVIKDGDKDGPTDREGRSCGEKQEQLHQFDAVLERMRKAASLVVK